jgi:glycosyltransferase involved in cell wall biosynthesis
VDITHATGFVVWLKTDLNTVHFVHSGWLSSKAFPYRPTASAYYFYQFVYTTLNSMLERIAFAKSRQLVAVSEAVKRELEQVNKAYRITVVHNGVDIVEFCPGPSERDKFDLPEGRRLFLFAGDIRTPRKNLGTVLKAMTKVVNAELVVAGDLKGSPYPKLADELGLRGRIHFVGRTADMPSLMRSVDVFVFPSRYEPFGLVILEALASGLPIVTTATSGGSEVVGGAGIVLQDPDDTQTLAAAMQSLADDGARRFMMAGEARRIATSLSWRNMIEQYVKCYDVLTNSKSSFR